MPRLLLLVLYVSLHLVNALESHDSGFFEAMESVIKSLTQILGEMPELLVNFCISCAVAAFPLGFYVLFMVGGAPPEDGDETEEISADEKRQTIFTRSIAPENYKVSCPFISDDLPSERSRFHPSDMALVNASVPSAESFEPAIHSSNSENNALVLRLTNAPSEESGQYSLSRHSPKENVSVICVKIYPLEESRNSTLPRRSTGSASFAYTDNSPHEELCQSTLVLDPWIDPLTLMFLYHGVDMYEAFPLEVRRQLSSTSPTDEASMTCKVITKPPQISTLLSNLKCPPILENKLGIAVTCVLLSFTVYRIIRR